MSDAVAAVADLFRAIPARVRQTIYGVLGLVVLGDAWWGLLPEDVSGNVVATFTGLTLVMALANATVKPLPPPPPPQPGLPENFPNEFA